MGFDIRIETDINIPADLKKVDNDTFWTFAASDWHRLISLYTPMETGNLRNNVTVKPKVIEYNAPYAHYLYKGEVMGPNYYNPDYGFWSPPGKKKSYTGKQIAFHNKNPLSSKEWDKAARPTQEPILISSLQKYVDEGRLNLSD